MPLRAKVLEALPPRRIDTRLVFPGHDGNHLKLKTFYLRHWTPALRASGVTHRGVYVGTSVPQIDQTYGHLVPDSENYLRGLLDSYDAGLEAGKVCNRSPGE